MHATLFQFIAASAVFLAILLQGCASSAPVRFYTLAPVKEPVASARESAVRSRFTVGVGPVEIPDFLERPHIVTRSGGNEMIMAEHDRWAGSLKQDMARVLTKDLSAYLAPEASVLSWKRGISPDWRVAVEITRLDVTPGREVVLEAQWVLFSGERNIPLKLRGQTFTESLGEKDINSAVAAIGSAIGRLGKEIAGDVRGEWREVAHPK